MILERNIHKFSSGIKLECGKSLASFDLMVDTYGELNSDKSNAILICHAFSGSHHAAGKSDDDENLGWWDNLIGPDKAIDTNKFFVVSPNNLGSCFGSTGPTSMCPENNEPYGKDFPSVTVLDWVNSQEMLLNKLGIDSWEAVIGGSLGGMQALQWSISFPDKIKRACIMAAAAKASSQNIALNEVSRESIRKDSNFHDGDYLKHGTFPKSGLKAARMLAHITYLSEENMDQRFGRRFQDDGTKVEDFVDYEVENYLQYKGNKFSETFDANTYILMSRAMDGFDPAKDFDGELRKTLKNIQAKILIIGFKSDWLFPPERGKEIQLAAMQCGISSSYLELDGEQGHDSFLFADERYVKNIEAFLSS
ncbi:homoserine O-acetyltransferase [Gammaproteobacteria bacterium]|nr:homoserine O-acetyltransferase [Gammaproteobacteria bacterium]MDB9997144.1 homoserine O-acetyltransferase [Gammaproteobacteria bacterium]